MLHREKGRPRHGSPDRVVRGRETWGKILQEGIRYHRWKSENRIHTLIFVEFYIVFLRTQSRSISHQVRAINSLRIHWPVTDDRGKGAQSLLQEVQSQNIEAKRPPNTSREQKDTSLNGGNARSVLHYHCRRPLRARRQLCPQTTHSPFTVSQYAPATTVVIDMNSQGAGFTLGSSTGFFHSLSMYD